MGRSHCFLALFLLRLDQGVVVFLNMQTKKPLGGEILSALRTAVNMCLGIMDLILFKG